MYGIQMDKMGKIKVSTHNVPTGAKCTKNILAFYLRVKIMNIKMASKKVMIFSTQTVHKTLGMGKGKIKNLSRLAHFHVLEV
jgi:hypothetical protein